MLYYISDDAESALLRLRKTIHVLDIIMLNESKNKIRYTNVKTVKPWIETLKYMKQQILSKHNSQDNNVHHCQSQLFLI